MSAATASDSATPRRPPMSGRALLAEFRTMWRWMTPSRRRDAKRLVVLLVFSAIAEIFTIGSVVPFLVILVGGGTDSAIAELLPAMGPDVTDRTTMILAAGGVIVLAAVISAGLHVILSRRMYRWLHGLGHDMSVEIYARRLHQPYDEYVRGHSSTVISALDQVQGLVGGVLIPATNLIIALVLCCVITGFFIVIEPLIALAIFLFVTVTYGVIVLITRPRLGYNASVLGALYRARVKSVQDGMGGARDIMIDRTQHVFVDDFSAVNAQFRDIQASTAFISDAPRRVVQSMGVVVIAGMAILLTLRMGSATAAIPTLGAMALGAQRLLPLIQQIYRARSAFAAYGILLRDINAMLAQPVATDSEACVNGAGELSFHDKIVFDGVRYAYPEAATPVLDRLDLVIKAGARVGVVGPSGSGKSTLIDLLVGLLQPHEGVITVDGRALNNATRAAWQARIAYVPQSIFMTDGSIAENIAFGRRGAQVDMGSVRAAARAAEIDRFVESLPEGYGTRMGEHGAMVSGGQRQRIGIARALYKRPAVLVLDEATSALDDPTEAAVVASLSRLGRGITIISVTHRLARLKDCDRIIRLESGRVVSEDAAGPEDERPSAGPD